MSVDPRALLLTARELIEHPETESASWWPRGAALLGRQALEAAVSGYWERTEPRVAEATTTTQLICLPGYLDDASASADARFAWASLSSACHHHAYELAPTARELSNLLDLVEKQLDLLQTETSL